MVRRSSIHQFIDNRYCNAMRMAMANRQSMATSRAAGDRWLNLLLPAILLFAHSCSQHLPPFRHETRNATRGSSRPFSATTAKLFPKRRQSVFPLFLSLTPNPNSKPKPNLSKLNHDVRQRIQPPPSAPPAAPSSPSTHRLLIIIVIGGC